MFYNLEEEASQYLNMSGKPVAEGDYPSCGPSSPSIPHHHLSLIIIYPSSPSIPHHHLSLITIYPSSPSIPHHHLFLIIIYTSTSDEEYLKSLGGESASTGDSYPHCYHHPLPPLSYIYLSIISIYLSYLSIHL